MIVKQIIILDYGHSAVDPIDGKCSPDRSFHEWRFNRILGTKIRDSLTSLGFTVKEVVSNLEDQKVVKVTERSRRVNKICDEFGSNNCLLISVHANAAGNGTWMTARGWSVYVSKRCSKASKELASHIFDSVASKGFMMRKPNPGQKYWEANYIIVKATRCKAVLTESLFYDNQEDLALLKDETIIQKLAQAHVDGIISYLGSLQ